MKGWATNRRFGNRRSQTLRSPSPSSLCFAPFPARPFPLGRASPPVKSRPSTRLSVSRLSPPLSPLFSNGWRRRPAAPPPPPPSPLHTALARCRSLHPAHTVCIASSLALRNHQACLCSSIRPLRGRAGHCCHRFSSIPLASLEWLLQLESESLSLDFFLLRPEPYHWRRRHGED